MTYADVDTPIFNLSIVQPTSESGINPEAVFAVTNFFQVTYADEDTPIFDLSMVKPIISDSGISQDAAFAVTNCSETDPFSR